MRRIDGFVEMKEDGVKNKEMMSAADIKNNKRIIFIFRYNE